MAYKNKKKNKAHIAKLQNEGWRKENRESRKLSEEVKQLKSFGLSTRKAHEIIELRKANLNQQ